MAGRRNIMGRVCALGLGGGVAIGGNSLATASGCLIASNATGSSSMTVDGSSTVNAYSLSAVGTCSGCSGSNVSLTLPARSNAALASDPFAGLRSKVLPSFGTSETCRDAPSGGGGASPSERAFCSDIKLTNGQTLTFEPGVYYLWNASINFGGGTVTCPNCTDDQGVTFVFTGNAPYNVGTLNINAQAKVDLRASRSAADPDWTGILFYGEGSGTVQINGGGETRLVGGMYFPRAPTKFNGNSGNKISNCVSLVAYSLDFRGSNSTTLDTSGCPDVGAPVGEVAIPQDVRIIQ